jgi:DNA-binding MarR family transcriptional regulator
VFERDLSIAEYRHRHWQMARDLRALDRQGLVERKEVAADRTGRHVRAVTLTPAGRALVERHASPSRFSKDGGRPVHSGWGKPRELAHDASLYRMYLAEEQRILNEGGSVRAVLLDDELKHRVFESLDEWRDDTTDANRSRLLELAQAEDIPVIDDHLQFPDLRIEYDTASGARTKVDLELTTEHYRGRQLSAKRQAGFTMYGAHGHSLAGTSTGGGAVAVNPDFLSGLLSL